MIAVVAWTIENDLFTRTTDLEDIKIIGNPWIIVGVPYNASIDLIKKVYTGACAHHLGFKF